MGSDKLSTKLLFDEIFKASEKKSEVLEIDFELEFENNNPKIFSVVENISWGTFSVFFDIKNQDLYYVVNIEDSELNEVINGYFCAKYQLSMIVNSKRNIDDLINLFKFQPTFKNDYVHTLTSTVGFTFNLTPNLLQNQILEFLDIMDSDKINFQKLLRENFGYLSIGIPRNDKVKDLIPLPIISNELIKRLSEYNLSIQFGKIIKD
ncbi:hypothetical protein [Chryseobacterium chendengshani]|uniref:hypothetical protein n=1 Tax=Chryseobacterium sp. LJ756 TaxID=2864113 RepID=UPI001C643C83|nr:hypothetical protein [Chryseobacterium sp. LJ756]MBW7674849.1 hypothetical protein [Chryseobacterium sp. LJ756]